MRSAHPNNAAAQWATIFFGVAGILAIISSFLLATTSEQLRAFIALGVLDLVIAGMIRVLPWGNWPARALLAIVVIGFVIIGLFALVGAHTLVTYPIFFILLFIWVGLSQPPRTALWLTPLTIVAYIVPLWLIGSLAPALASVVVVVAVCVLIGEVLARVLYRLHATQNELEQRVIERTAQLQTTNTELQNELVERKRLEAQLLHSQKLEGIGRLAGGIAHDFNNILMAIGGYADLIIMALPRDHASRRDADEIQRSVTRASALTRQLLAFARQQPIEPQPLNLNELVGDLHNLLRRVIGEDIELSTRLAPDLGWISADTGQITQVILNLAVNARDAMPTGGKLEIETRNLDGDSRAVCITVRDTGTGMEPVVQAHAFEPFFTTKAVGKGTGLGLATCYGIIEQHGGTISLASEHGQGTTFTIILPQVPPPTQMQIAPVVVTTLPQGAETVLVVEDDLAVRSVTARTLRQHGYTVLEADTSADALVVAQSCATTMLDLLVTDVVMPGIGGEAIAAQLRTQHPKLKVLFISGYADHAIDLDTQLALGSTLLHKPFTTDMLINTVRDMLDQAPRPV